MIRAIRMSLAERATPTVCALSLLLAGSQQTVTQSSTADPFDQYRVKDNFKGKPSPPVLSSPEAHEFRTKIRQGVAKGVAFAGHYEVAVWGCGSGCLSFAVIDALTGKVTFFPASVEQNREAGERLTYRRNSRAIHLIGSLNEEDSADRWYVWDEDEFKLISRRPAILVDENGNPLNH